MAKGKPTGFGVRLRAIREAKGLTQEQVAERAGMVYQAITRIESGDDNPTWRTILKLAEALGVTPDDFLGDDEPAGGGAGGKPIRPKGK